MSDCSARASYKGWSLRMSGVQTYTDVPRFLKKINKQNKRERPSSIFEFGLKYELA